MNFVPDYSESVLPSSQSSSSSSVSFESVSSSSSGSFEEVEEREDFFGRVLRTHRDRVQQENEAQPPGRYAFRQRTPRT